MSKLKVAWLAPCIGVGGADALMAGLCRYGQTIETVGIVIAGNYLTEQHVEWFTKTAGSVRVHCPKRDHCFPGITYHDDLPAAIRVVARNADIWISWSTPRLNAVRTNCRRLPLVELAQNSDGETRKIVETNARVADFYAAVSEAARDLFPQQEQWRVQIIPNGVDAARITPRFGRAATRNRWGVTDDEKVVAYMGRFEKYKRPHAIVHAISQMPEWHVVFIGRGSQRSTLAELAEYLAPGRVHFEDYTQQIGDTLAGADVLALPSDFEGDPLIVHEAHLAGLPVVATRIPPLVEKEQRFGKMVELIPPPADRRDLRRALLTASDAAFTAVAAHAHRQTFANFTMSTITARWEWFCMTACWNGDVVKCSVARSARFIHRFSARDLSHDRSSKSRTRHPAAAQDRQFQRPRRTLHSGVRRHLRRWTATWKSGCDRMPCVRDSAAIL